MAITDKEKEWALRVSRFIKAELKRAGVSYKELARRLEGAGLAGDGGFDHGQAGPGDVRGHVLFGYAGSAGDGGYPAGGFVIMLWVLDLYQAECRLFGRAYRP